MELEKVLSFTDGLFCKCTFHLSTNNETPLAVLVRNIAHVLVFLCMVDNNWQGILILNPDLANALRKYDREADLASKVITYYNTTPA